MAAIQYVDTTPVIGFTKYNSDGSITYKPKQTDVGSYQLYCTFRDSNFMPVGSTYQFSVKVNAIPTPPKFVCPYGSLSKCNPRILSASDTGILTLAFPVALKMIN